MALSPPFAVFVGYSLVELAVFWACGHCPWPKRPGAAFASSEVVLVEV
jgi:hypothetical protein